MLVVMIRFYYSVMCYLFLENDSSCPGWLEKSHFNKGKISTHLQALKTKVVTREEMAVFEQIEELFGNTTLPKKGKLVQAFTHLRLMLTLEVDTIITEVARAVFEELENCVDVGNIEKCWYPWSQRIKLSVSNVIKMEKVLGYVKVNNTLHQLCAQYKDKVETDFKNEESSISMAIQDHCVSRKRRFQ